MVINQLGRVKNKTTKTGCKNWPPFKLCASLECPTPFLYGLTLKASFKGQLGLSTCLKPKKVLFGESLNGPFDKQKVHGAGMGDGCRLFQNCATPKSTLTQSFSLLSLIILCSALNMACRQHINQAGQRMKEWMTRQYFIVKNLIQSSDAEHLLLGSRERIWRRIPYQTDTGKRHPTVI